MKKSVDVSNFEYKDLLGNEIKVDDFIVYGAVDGRSGVLRVGQVIELTYTKGGYGDVVPKVRVKSWSNSRTFWGHDNEERSGRQKNVTLGFLDRMIVVQADQVNEKIKRDLEGPICDYTGTPITK